MACKNLIFLNDNKSFKACFLDGEKIKGKGNNESISKVFNELQTEFDLTFLIE